MHILMEVHRENSSMVVLVDIDGMVITFLNPQNSMYSWDLKAYPKDFIDASKKSDEPEFDCEDFTICTNHRIYFYGNFEKSENAEFVNLDFTKFADPPSMRITLRKSEVAKLVQILEDYFTC